MEDVTCICVSHTALPASVHHIKLNRTVYPVAFLPPPYSPMSHSESKPLSNSNYQHIFSDALASYKKRTGNDLTSNPLLPRLETCNSPNAVIALLQEQIPGFDQSRSDNDSERLSNWLNPTVNVIAAFSGTIGDSVGLVGLSVFHLTLSRLRTLKCVL